tara:strand:- start:98 stop:469 length:372 start_codon:yes stop_codon:yes gene_type:complete
MKYARIENKIVREIIDICDNDINKMFTKELVQSMVEIPEDIEVKESYVYENGIFSEPEQPKTSWEEIRRKRNQLLQESDWIALNDVCLTDEQKQLWKKYRQKLRDIPQTLKNPEDVKWLEKPE